MSLQIGDTGKSQIGSLKSFVISPGTARETLLGTALTLPTTEPATAQVSFTIQTSDLPTITGNALMKYNPALYISGKIGAVASVINYRVLKNGVSVAQAAGASATATQFWAHTHWRTFDVQVGDVLDVKYWAAQADVTLDYYGLIVYPSQPEVSKRGTILKDLVLDSVTNGASFITSGVAANNSSNFFILPTTTTAVSVGLNVLTSFPALIPNSSFGLFRNNAADLFGTATTQNINATTRQIQKQLYPQTISFREVLR